MGRYNVEPVTLRQPEHVAGILVHPRHNNCRTFSCALEIRMNCKARAWPPGHQNRHWCLSAEFAPCGRLVARAYVYHSGTSWEYSGIDALSPPSQCLYVPGFLRYFGEIWRISISEGSAALNGHLKSVPLNFPEFVFKCFCE